MLFFKEIIFIYLEIFLKRNIFTRKEANSEAIPHFHQYDSQISSNSSRPHWVPLGPQFNSHLSVDIKSFSHHNMSTVYLPSLSPVLEQET